MRCVNCDTELLPDKQFCHNCGTRAAVVCPSCGATLGPGFRFCPDCGTRIGDEAPGTVAAAPAPAPEERLRKLAGNIPAELARKIQESAPASAGERKVATVLFCDLVGSTAIAEGLDPEDYHDLIEQYLERVCREIYALDGLVTHLAGDGVMALFGAPVAHEDAPLRAVRAAFAVRDALQRFNTEPGAPVTPLHVRVGIHTGPVLLGHVGNDLKTDYTALGDTTNLAARLQTAADPGVILISEATYRRVRGLVDAEPRGPFTVKGKREPIAAYEVVAVRDVATPMAIAAARGLTPFVGRSGELAQIIGCYERARGHFAQVVAVIGDAGSGKSRLVYEFRQQLESEDAVFLEGRCSSLSHVQPYAPWIAMLRQYFELNTCEAGGSACDKIAGKVSDLGLDLDQIHPYLRHLLSASAPKPAGESLEETKRSTFEAIGRLIGALCRRAPVVILFEDLHWIDDESREMLELAANKIYDRIMLLVSHRPEYQPAWRTRAAFTQLNLGPLADADVTAIVRAVAGGQLPAEIEHEVLLKAEGNPFFAEEITRTLVEEGNLIRDDGHFRLARPAEQISMPGTVEEVLAARLDRLGPHAKRVIQVAAVLGRQFRRAHILRLLENEDVDVAAVLDDMEHRGVIHRKTLLSDDEYRFGESLTQEVAYEGLLLKERRQLHERIGLLIEEEPGEATADRATLLAHHYARSDNRERAIDALLRAARHAEQVPSHRAAADSYRRAWELAESALQDGDNDALRGQVLEATLNLVRLCAIYNLPDQGHLEVAARRAGEIAEATGNTDALAQVSTLRGMHLIGGAPEQFAEGLALTETGVTIARRANQEATAASLTRGLAWAYLLDARLDAARRMITSVLEEMERLGQAAQLTDTYFGARFMSDRIAYHSDDLDTAVRTTLETLDLAVRTSNRTVQVGATETLARIAFERGAYAEAQQWAERCLDMALAIASSGAARTVAAILLATRVERGESRGTTRFLDIIDRGMVPTGDLALSTRIAVDALLAAGERQRAQRLAEIAHGRGGGRLREMYTAAALGYTLFAQDAAQWAEAEQWLTRAVELAEAHGSHSTLLWAQLGLGELALARGDTTAAAHLLDESRAGARRLGLGRYEARAERLLDQLAVAPRATA